MSNPVIFTRPPPPPPRCNSGSPSTSTSSSTLPAPLSSLSTNRATCDFDLSRSRTSHSGSPSRTYYPNNTNHRSDPFSLVGPTRNRPYRSNVTLHDMSERMERGDSRWATWSGTSGHSSRPNTPGHPTQNRPTSRTREPRESRVWRNWGKSLSADRVEDEPVQLQDASTLPVRCPPSIPSCSLEAAFKTSDTRTDIPPAFYPGQSIPTILTFKLDRYSFLPHHLEPALTMSLVGTLHLPNLPPRTIICVSVSLAEGLELWARDAQQAFANRPTHPSYPNVDPQTCLPGGTYSLPLTVQVPTTPRLPPTFKVHGATFAVTYALTVSLTCNDPARPFSRVQLAETAKSFEMMPETLPTMPSTHPYTSLVVRTERPNTAPSALGRPFIRRPSSKWGVQPHLPTTAYSPTSIIPLQLVLTPPDVDDADNDPIVNHPDYVPTPVHQHYQILIRLALIRREHSSHSATGPFPRQTPTLVNEVEVVSRYGYVEASTSKSIEINETLPLMVNNSWTHGFSTVLNIGNSETTPEIPPGDMIAVSSSFHLALTLAFLPIHPENEYDLTLKDCVPVQLPPMGTFSQPVAGPSPLDITRLKKRFPGTVKTIPMPVVVGSVSEPRSAMQTHRWSDLHLDRTSTGEEIARMINGESTTCENGWILPPPAYGEAIETVPYDFD